MDISKQVCSLEQAKKLKELGVKQESLFYHASYFERNIGERFIIVDMHEFNLNIRKANSYSAFTVAELGEMLPTGYDTMRLSTEKQMDSRLHGWFGYDDDDEDCPKKWMETGYATEAQCRAAMLIFILENNIINVSEVNERICSK